MTLLIASATQNEQIIAADRLLTDIRTQNKYSDSAYKIIQYINPIRGYKFAIAYTGLAVIGRQPTSEWLLDILPQVMPSNTYVGNGITNLTIECTRRFREIRNIPLQYKGITFVLCGQYQGTVGNNNTIRNIPFVSIISNSIDARGRQINKVSREFYAFEKRILDSKSYFHICRGDLVTAGKSIKELHQLYRLLRKKLPYKAKVRSMATYIRKQAKKSKTIGNDILGLAIIDTGAEAFDYHDRNNNPSVTMPHIAWADGAKLTNFTVRP